MNALIFIIIHLISTSATGSSECLLRNYAVPDSSLRLDPFKVDLINVTEHGLDIVSKDLEYVGLNDAVLYEFELNSMTNILHMKFHFHLLVKGVYKIEGTIFSEPAYGDGDVRVALQHAIVEMVIPFNIIQDGNGTKFVELQKYNYSQDILNNAEFSFSNLFNGDKEKSAAMHSAINQNWKIFTQQFGEPFMEQIAIHTFKIVKNYFLSTPLNEIPSC